jgi:hypothetical protein
MAGIGNVKLWLQILSQLMALRQFLHITDVSTLVANKQRGISVELELAYQRMIDLRGQEMIHRLPTRPIRKFHV